MLDKLKLTLAWIGLLLVLLFPGGHASCFAQNSPTSAPNTVPAEVISRKQLPFDKLELLAFAVGSFDSQYVAYEIDKRGLSFVPDAVFLNAVRTLGGRSAVLNALDDVRPTVNPVPSLTRESAYGLLLVAVGDAHKRRFDSANQDLQDALALAPDSATLHLAYAENLELQKKYVQAESECRRSLQLWSEDGDAHSLLASSLMGQNRDSEAIPEAHEALRIFPTSKAALVTLAIALTRNRQYEEAIPILRQAVVRGPEMPFLHKLLGVSLFQSGDTDGAIEQLSLYIKTEPNDPEGHYHLGVALRAKGRHDEALAQFNEAARISPANPLYATALDPEGTNKPPESNNPHPDGGSVSGNVYTNQFFGFSFEFPKGWTVLSADAARAIAEIGGATLANGDPTLQDAQHAVSRSTYPLFYAREGMTKNGMSVSSIQIQAMDLSIELNLNSPEEFLKRSSALLSGRFGTALNSVGASGKNTSRR